MNKFDKNHLVNATQTRRQFLKTVNGLAAGLAAAPFAKLAAAQAGVTYQAAVAQAESYDAKLILRKMTEMVDGLGGLADVVRPGDKVAIKINLTGGAQLKTSAPNIESFMTHPEIVSVLGQLVRDAGAKELYIVESVFDAESYSLFGYEKVAKKLKATLIDLNNPAPYADFETVAVGADSYIYSELILHRLLREVDTFISVAKLKCHTSCGVTLAMKNLVGLVPVAHYRLSEDHNWRSALHGADYSPGRIPRVVVDLNRARPINFSVIDGIKSAEGGEIPRGSFAPNEPGLLVAGKNALATDAVATALMGFNPEANFPDSPFLNGDNYLNLAYDRGLGTNRLSEIEVVGVPIAEAVYPFAPATSQ
ncbi:MAG TPA: DUF362 domain-containing protein [Phototrophicaceae bacterium]|nr:DUF362 domain-containing protein [Phototrophicaceae bacterium]